MTNEFLLFHQTLVGSRPTSIHDKGASPPAFWSVIDPQPWLPNPKRKVLHHCCSRLAASGLPGADMAIEYIYGKYIKNLSVHTIRQSGTVLLSFLRFLVSDGATLQTLTRRNIAAYVEYEQEAGLKTMSVIGHLRALYAFIAFLVEQGILSPTIMERKIRLKQPDALPRAISHEDVSLLLGAVRRVRDRAMILLLLRTGMRIGELLAVKIHDISFPEKKILLYLGEKNYQGRAVYYSEDAEDALRQWLQMREQDSAYLFPGKKSPQLSYMTAWNVMQQSLKRAGLSHKKYSLHSLRHTFATDMLNAGMRIEVLQQLLGHQEIEMTMRYARLSDQTREHEYFKAMDNIEQGKCHEPHRINHELQKVFEEKKLLRAYGKKLSQ